MRVALGLSVFGILSAGQVHAQCPPKASDAASVYSRLGPVIATETTDGGTSEARRVTGMTLLGQPVTYAIRFRIKEGNRVLALLYRLGSEVTPVSGELSEGIRSQFQALFGDETCRTQRLCITHPYENDDMGMLFSTSLAAEGTGSWAGPGGAEMIRERAALNALSQKPVYLVCTYNAF